MGVVIGPVLQLRKLRTKLRTKVKELISGRIRILGLSHHRPLLLACKWSLSHVLSKDL